MATHGGRRGVQPKPTKLRLLDGARPVDVNMNEPIPRPGKIIPPPGMSQPVREIFEWVVDELEAMNIGAPVDRDALAAYAEAIKTHRDASALLAKSAVLIKGSNGRLVRNPATTLQTHAAHLIRQLAQEFGLTPSARARIEATESSGDQSNPFAGLG